MASETLRIIYYLSREGILEEPHLLEVPLSASSSDGLHLIDVKRWLMLTRGNSMPTSFSWSFKRDYKEGCIWQDLSANEDLILPSSEGEYILKGSKCLVAVKEEPMLTTTFPIDTKYDVIEDDKKVNTENTNRLPASNQEDVNIGKDCCSFALSYRSRNSDIVHDMDHIHVDQSTMDSSSGTLNDHHLMNLHISLLQSTTVLEDNAEERGEIKLHGDLEESAALAILDDQSSGLSTAIVSQTTQLASNPNQKLLELSTSKKASSYQVHDKRRTCRPLSGAISSNADLLIVPRSTAKTVDYNMNGYDERACDTIGPQTQACLDAECTTVHKTDSCGLHAHDSAEPQTQAYPCAEKPCLSRSMYTKSKSRLHHLNWASCTAEDSNVMDIQGQPFNKCSNKTIAPQRSTKTKCRCNHITVLPSHVIVNSLSTHRLPVPFSRDSNDRLLVETEGQIQSHNLKVCNKRVTYSDQLGVELPVTMSMSHVSGQKSASMCSSQQRLAPGKTSLGSARKSAYGPKHAMSHHLRKGSSLPVFGSEPQQHQRLQKLEWFGIDSIPNFSQRRLGELHQGSQFVMHGHHARGKLHDRHHHDRAELQKDGANLNTKTLWEELLQTTQQVFTSQEST